VGSTLEPADEAKIAPAIFWSGCVPYAFPVAVFPFLNRPRLQEAGCWTLGMMDLDLDAETERPSNPLDLVERLASLNDWSFDRDSDDELSVSVTGGWADYHVAITWLAEVESLHIACAFDLRVPDRRRNEVMNLVSLVNEQLWLGHFDLWSRENVVMYRHALLLSGGAEPTEEQAAGLIKAAIDACERYYQAFQFVVWAGKNAREALEGALLETVGEA
jgi:hypothetical protein